MLLECRPHHWRATSLRTRQLHFFPILAGASIHLRPHASILQIYPSSPPGLTCRWRPHLGLHRRRQFLHLGAPPSILRPWLPPIGYWSTPLDSIQLCPPSILFWKFFLLSVEEEELRLLVPGVSYKYIFWFRCWYFLNAFVPLGLKGYAYIDVQVQ
jgi:hypothetical protein